MGGWLSLKSSPYDAEKRKYLAPTPKKYIPNSGRAMSQK